MSKQYDKYKNSGIEWIGEIPEHWEICKLLKIFKNRKLPNDNNIENNVLSLSYGNIKRRNIENNMGLLPESFESYNIIEPNNIVLRLTDLQNDHKSLRCGLVKEKGIITSAYVTLELKEKNQCANYFYRLLHTFDIMKGFYGMGAGVRQSLKFEGELCNLYIVKPPVNEQQKIADYLDKKCEDIDKIIEMQKNLIEKLKEYKQAVITEAVTKGLDKSAPLKDSGIKWIGEIPEQWEVKKLKQLISKPLQYGANESGVIYNENYPRYIRITDIKENNSLKDDGKLSLLPQNAQDYILENDDILFARSGATVGKTFIYKTEYGLSAFAGYLIRACLKVEINASYIYYFTLSSAYEKWKDRIFIQATIQNIGANKYNNMEIVLPQKTIQDFIVDYLDKKCSEIDTAISEKEQLIEKLIEYKKSLIYECVTGKRRSNYV